MPNPELARPYWRSGAAYAEALPQERVAKEIKGTLLANKYPKFPRKTETSEKEVDEYFPTLLNELRLHDLGSSWYWGTMLLLCVAFLCAELFLFLSVSKSTQTLATFELYIVICLIVLVALFCVYVYALVRLHSHTDLPKLLRSVPTTWFHAMPVVWVSLCSVGLNFYIVTQTGYSESPFLHALLASSLVILSLPRENSALVIGIALVALAAGTWGAAVTGTVSQQQLTNWGGYELAKRLVLLTFIYSGVSAVLLRYVANYKLSPKIVNDENATQQTKIQVPRMERL